MGKRYVDTNLPEKEWWQLLTPTMKCLWIYILLRCDGAGVWCVNRRQAEFAINSEESIDWDSVLDVFGDHIEEIAPGKWWLTDFCNFQYVSLRFNSNPHASALKLLDKYGLTDRPEVSITQGLPKDYPRVHQGLPNPCSRVKDKDKAQDKDKDKDPTVGGCGGKEPKVFSPQVEELYAIGVANFADAGHKVPSTPKQVEAAKDVIRLMLERDKISPADLRQGLEYVAGDTGNGKWPGWRATCRSFSGLRDKWESIGPQMRAARENRKPKRQGVEIEPCDRDGAKLPW